MNAPAPTPLLTGEQRRLVDEAEDRVDMIVKSAARRVGRRAPFDDMLQAGKLACVECVLRLDRNRGIPFHAFYSKRVYGAAMDAAAHILFGGRRGRGYRKRFDAFDEAPQDPGDDAVSRELRGQATDPRAEMLHRARAIAGMLMSAASREAADGEETADELRQRAYREKLVRDGMATLPERERRVLMQLRFEDADQASVANSEQLSTRHVSRVEHAACALLAKYVTQQTREPVAARK